MFDTRFKTKKELKKYIKALEEQLTMMCETDIDQTEKITLLEKNCSSLYKTIDLQRENIEKYKRLYEGKMRYCKELPEGVDFIILAKSDYDRRKDEFEPAYEELKRRIDKTLDYINENYTNPNGFCWHSGFWPILEILKDVKITSEFEEEDNE